jgi:pimeloyl-[acyl-carrier protein] synthase
LSPTGALARAFVQPEIDRRLAERPFVENPYPLYAEMRDKAPVFFSEHFHAIVLTRFEDINAVLRDTGRFSNAGRFAQLLDQLPGSVEEVVQPLRQHYASGLIQSDPPDHSRVRSLVSKGFTPKAVREVGPWIEGLVEELLSRAVERGRFDVLSDLARPLPAMVIAEMLGVPSADRAQFIPLGDDLTALQAKGRAAEEGARSAASAVLQLEDYFRALYRERKREPRDDLISALVAAHDGSDRLTENELINTCVTILVAGHETTRNFIGNAALTLSQHPEQWRLLKEDPSLLPTAVDELLRYESSIQRGWRRVTGDTDLLGYPASKDDLVFLMLGAANRDPRRFERPDELDLGRADNPHLAFGRGPHFCLGAPLARLEGAMALAALVRRFERLEVTCDVVWEDSVHMRGVRQLTVNLDLLEAT